MRQKLPSILLLVVVCSTCLLLSLDSFTNTEKVKAIIGIASYYFVIPVLCIHAFIRIKKNIFLPSRATLLLIKIVVPFLSGVVIILSLLDWVLPVNYVYSVTKLHQEQLGLLTLYLILTGFINNSTRWWKRHYLTVIRLVPYAFLGIAMLVRMWPWNIFFELVKEDALIEQLQATVLFVGGIVGLYFSWIAQKEKHTRLLFVSLLLSLGLLFVSLEEISWGQRLIGFSTPSDFSTYNLQNETTVHNIDGVHQKVNSMYVAVAIAGMVGKSTLLRVLLKKSSIRLRKQQMKQYFGYFIFPLVYYTSTFILPDGTFREWSEVMELYIYTGVVLTVLEVLYVELEE